MIHISSIALLDISSLPPALANIDIISPESLERVYYLTERPLRCQRRDALRTARDYILPTSSPASGHQRVMRG